MIRKADEMRIAQEKNLKGGEGTVQLVHFLTEQEIYGTGRLYGLTVVPPGCSIGYHQHQGEFEIYYILKGQAKVMDNDKEVILVPGDCMMCRDGEFHSIENIGEGDLEYLATILYTEKK